MRKTPKPRRYADDAALTAKELKTARHLSACAPEFVAVIKKNLGRPTGRTKTPVHLSLDTDLVEALRHTGKGWQTRANAALRKSFKLPPLPETVQR